MDALMQNMGTVQTMDFNTDMFNDFIAFIDRGERTTQTYLTNLRQFAAWMKYAGISRPAHKDILLYRDYLSREHDAIKYDINSPAGYSYQTDKKGNHIKVMCKPNTVAQYLRSVCQFFKWTAAAGLYPDIASNVHAPKVGHEEHRKEALSADDVLAIEQSIIRSNKEAILKADSRNVKRVTEQGKRLYAMYELAVNAGLRTIELERANVKDLEVRHGNAVLYIWGKGHTEPDQRKPLAPEVYVAIRDYLDSRSDPPTANSPLFVATGNRSGGQRIAARTISQMLKRTMKKAGFDSERITAHSLRHTAGTNVMSISGNIYDVQHYMRHSNPATTEIYLHNNTEKQEAYLAQELYDLYHNKKTGTEQEKLENLIVTMNPEQISQLTGIAAALKGNR